MTSTLYLIRGDAEKRRIIATIYREADGSISWSTENEMLAPLLERLLKRDFSEHMGFPARRRRAPLGSIEAFDLAAQYLVSTMGYGAVLSQVAVQAVSQQPPRVSRRASLEVMRALEVVHAMHVENRLAQQVAARQAVLDLRYSEAVRFGSTFEFFRQHHMRRKVSSEVVSTRARGGSWFRVGAMPSQAGASPERDDDLSAGVFLSKSGPVQELRPS